MEICEDGVDNDCGGTDNTCGVHGAISLADASATIVGETIGDAAGLQICFGDLDGDDYHDIVVAAPGEATRGAVYVLKGEPSLILGEISLATAHAKLSGETLDDLAGYGLSTGDFDADGYDDLLVGAPARMADAGGVYLLYGSSAGPSSTSLAGADAIFSDATTTDEAGVGVSLSGRGDVDADGHDDLLIGAVGSDGSGVDSGAAYLIRGGGTRWSGTQDVTTAGTRFVGEVTGDRAGWTVSHAGDIDGDGDGDILIAAYTEHTVAVSNGAVYLILGTSTPTTGDMSLSDADAKYVGAMAYDFVGAATAGAGDVDSDGYQEFLVGATGDAGVGAAYLVWGRSSPFLGTRTLQTSTIATRIRGEATGDDAGASVAGVGDVDADGFADLLIGAPKADIGGDASGAAYLVLGQSSLAATVDLAAADAVIAGASSLERAGSAVSGAGDVNGDGWSDLLIGSYRIETAYLLYGAD